MMVLFASGRRAWSGLTCAWSSRVVHRKTRGVSGQCYSDDLTTHNRKSTCRARGTGDAGQDKPGPRRPRVRGENRKAIADSHQGKRGKGRQVSVGCSPCSRGGHPGVSVANFQLGVRWGHERTEGTYHFEVSMGGCLSLAEGCLTATDDIVNDFLDRQSRYYHVSPG